MQENNFQMAINKCENILNMWHIQKLTLKGKKLIVNTLAILQMLYLSSIKIVPNNMIKRLQTLITSPCGMVSPQI